MDFEDLIFCRYTFQIEIDLNDLLMKEALTYFENVFEPYYSSIITITGAFENGDQSNLFLDNSEFFQSLLVLLPLLRSNHLLFAVLTFSLGHISFEGAFAFSTSR